MCIEKQYMQSTKSSIWMSLALEEKKKKKKTAIGPLIISTWPQGLVPLDGQKKKKPQVCIMRP